MKDYVLISDSTADLPIEVIKELGVPIIPFTYIIDEKEYSYKLNEDDVSMPDFYNEIRSGAMPVTSQINPGVYTEILKKYVKEGKSIVYLCFSSGLSGSFQTANLAVSMIKEENEDADIVVIDSISASIGQGVLLYAVAKLKQQGMPMDELVKWTTDNRLKTRHWFIVEDLFHLKRGGRVSAVEAVVGSALKIKPILSLDAEGKLVVKSKARGTIKALDYLIARVKEEGEPLDELIAVIGHADSNDKAEKLKALAIEAGLKEENIMTAYIGPIIGTHVGPGMTAIAFVSKTVSN